MVVGEAMAVSVMVVAMVQEALAMAAAVEAVKAKHAKMVVVVRAPEATGRAGGAGGWRVQVHVEEGRAMRMVEGVAMVVSVTVAETVREA